MKISTKFHITESQDKVWEVFLNPKDIGHTFPGCESVKEIDVDTYLSMVIVKFDYLKARFKLISKIVEQSSPFQIMTHTTWEGIGILGNVSQTTTLKLNPSKDSSTEVTIDTELNVTGTIANLGTRIVRTKVESVAEEGIQSMKSLIEEKIGIETRKVHTIDENIEVNDLCKTQN